MGDLTKTFLYAWCDKQKVIPEYEFKSTGPKHRQRFLCEVRVPGYDYVGTGNSTNKNDSQTNAARDFLQYLVRNNHLPQSDVPTEIPTGGPPAPTADSASDGQCPPHKIKPVSPHQQGQCTSYANRLAEKRRLVEAEDLEANSHIHGNWTIDNAKTRLHQFLQVNRIHADYAYTETGPDRSKTFFAEMGFFIHKLNMKIHAREQGSTKQMASKACALSLVRQLHQLGLLEPYKKKTESKMDPYEVRLKPEVEKELNETINALGIETVTVPVNVEQLSEPFFLKACHLDVDEVVSEPVAGGVVPWSPPQQNWNPWTSCSIDEGSMATMTLTQISDDLLNGYNHQVDHDPKLKQMLDERFQLPVYNSYDSILDAIHESSVVIIRGATGCGKTTQVPQYILDSYINQGIGAECCVVVTQPRKINAASVAARIAEERSEELGQSVGYSVQFDPVLPRPYGSIMFCTVCDLLRMMEAGLCGVSHIIIDEINERDLNTDFILVVVRDMVRAFPQLRVILMSAAVDVTLFQSYFDNCPVVEVEGCTHPVQELFLEDCIELINFVPPPVPKKRMKDDDDIETDEPQDNLNKVIDPSYKPSTKIAMAQLDEEAVSFELIDELLLHIQGLSEKGAVLIFLPNWNLIFALMKHLQKHPTLGTTQYQILPLHPQISQDDQRKVFTPVPDSVTKVILSTDIAETSVTINDVVYVIDSCKAEMKQFTSHNNIPSYATVFPSKANLEQRRRRAGCVRPGYCYHLCSKARHKKLDDYTTPEISRAPLHELALAIKLLRLGDITKFFSKAPEPPPMDAVMESEVSLREMGALRATGELTPLGKILARLPIEPRLGKMLILGLIFGAGDAVTTISANTLSTFSELFDVPLHVRKWLACVHRRFFGDRWSDHITLLNVFGQWEQAHKQGEVAESSFCEQFSISMPMLRITYDTKNKIKELLTAAGFPDEPMAPKVYNFSSVDPELDMTVALLLLGHYPNICYHNCHLKQKRKVLTRDNQPALIHKTSVNFTNLPASNKFPSPFFVFGEKTLTKAASCKQMTMISPMHILLFGCRRVVLVNGVVEVDDWINLKMDPQVAANVLSLRQAIDNLVAEVTADPEMLTHPSEDFTRVVSTVKKLCQFNSIQVVSQTGVTESFGRSDGRTHERTGGRIHGHTGRWTDKRAGGRTDKRAGGRADRQARNAQPFKKMPRLSSGDSGRAGPDADYSIDSHGGFRESSQGGFRYGYRAESRGNFSPEFSGSYNHTHGFGYSNDIGSGSSGGSGIFGSGGYRGCGGYGNSGGYGRSGDYGNGSYSSRNQGGNGDGSYHGGERFNARGWHGGRGQPRGYRGSVW